MILNNDSAGEMIDPNSQIVSKLGLNPIPLASYRLQLNAQFGFSDAARLVPYLHQLGISHCYTSPFLKARSGSSHGYDIVDHNQLNPEMGSQKEFETFIDNLHRYDMGLIADIVPNHMGIMGSDNGWWLDVLENGQASMYSDFFDIDWQPVKRSLQNKILLPVLGDHYGIILQQQELQLVFDAVTGEFSVVYFQHRFPVDPQTYPVILNAQGEQIRPFFQKDDPCFLEYQTLTNSFGKLPLHTQADRKQREDRHRDKAFFKQHLAELCSRSMPIMQFIQYRVSQINQDHSDRGELHLLLEKQVYRLAFWRVAGDEINYRRFFDINDLAGMRIETEAVFEATHQLTLSLIAQHKIQGLRIDHADGLYDPINYYRHLHSCISALFNSEPVLMPIYTVAEKIVANYEYLASDWPIDGTTGYEFANMVNGFFVDNRAKNRLTNCYARFIGQRLNFDLLVYQAKKQVITTRLTSELNVLVNQLSKIAEANVKTRDYTLNALRDALTEVVACFPVYRTYINNRSVSQQDAEYIIWAITQAEHNSQAPDKTVFEFIRSILLLEASGLVPLAIVLKFVMKFQQYTAPVMAKGYEDTALYRYHRLISLNEVGGDPRHFGHSAKAFHHFNLQRVKKWPHSMLSLSTHDSKHSADMRARINVLSEVSEQWQAAVKRWHKWNQAEVNHSMQTVVNRNDEYLFYQVLIGTWPLTDLNETEFENYFWRVESYMIKAIREAKINTSWSNPNSDYEECVRLWIRRCLDFNLNALFLNDFRVFEQRIRTPGLYNALAQTLLLLTAPGMPDIYQGHEVWQFSLVDPDNRRSVEFEQIKAMANEMATLMASSEFDRLTFINSMLANMSDGRIKFFVTQQTLDIRKQYADLFTHGDYLPIKVHGKNANCLLAFARQNEEHFAIIIVARLTTHLFESERSYDLHHVWFDTWLEIPQQAPEQYYERFTESWVYTQTRFEKRQLLIKDLVKKLPIACLTANR